MKTFKEFQEGYMGPAVKPIPLAKRGKINSDVLKSNPQLNPDKPGDYIKLKRLSAKIKKA